MIKNNLKFALFGLIVFLSVSCKKEHAADPMLVIRLSVDSTQERLGNTGMPASLPTGHAAQSPRFNKIAAHYLEFAQTGLTLLGSGAILYHAPETDQGGTTAIDFSKSKVVTPGDVFLTIPLKNLPAGSYSWVRLSLSYQNYEVDYRLNNMPTTGTVASFLGYNQYISNYTVESLVDTVNGNRLQGYWAFESIGFLARGQSPQGATTVPNPLASTSPIPPGSCVVTGSFASPLVISGDETSDININMSLSTNNSFEWQDTNANGLWDIVAAGQASSAEPVVDMGLRGLIPSYTR